MATTIAKRQVQDVLTKDVVSVTATDSMREALNIMVENGVSALPVVNAEEVCIGIISATDVMALTRDLTDDVAHVYRNELAPQWLLDTLPEQDLQRRRVEELMTEVIETVTPETSIGEAARTMLRERVHRLPVVDDGKRLVGIVSTMDLLRAFVEAEAETD